VIVSNHDPRAVSFHSSTLVLRHFGRLELDGTTYRMKTKRIVRAVET
jgi:hypothetical protein